MYFKIVCQIPLFLSFKCKNRLIMNEYKIEYLFMHEH